MKRTPGGESKVPEIVEREALRDEVFILLFPVMNISNPWQLSDETDRFSVDREVRSVERGEGACFLFEFDALHPSSIKRRSSLVYPTV